MGCASGTGRRRALRGRLELADCNAGTLGVADDPGTAPARTRVVEVERQQEHLDGIGERDVAEGSRAPVRTARREAGADHDERTDAGARTHARCHASQAARPSGGQHGRSRCRAATMQACRRLSQGAVDCAAAAEDGYRAGTEARVAFDSPAQVDGLLVGRGGPLVCHQARRLPWTSMESTVRSVRRGGGSQASGRATTSLKGPRSSVHLL